MSDGGHWFHCARNAWQKLGNLSPETAMEQYIAIVSDKVPGWMENKCTVSISFLVLVYCERFFNLCMHSNMLLLNLNDQFYFTGR